MKRPRFTSLSVAAGFFGAVLTTPAANIVWISDASPAGFSGPGVGLTDQGFVTLLQNAGHNVIRFNGPDSQNTLLTAGDIAALNTNDLIILGRAGNSAQFQSPQGPQWNSLVTKPLICMSPYFVRPDGGRFGWFTGATVPDDVPTVLNAVTPTDPATDFLFGGVSMTGSTTTFAYDELIDRNTSHIQNAPVAGGIVYANATFPNENGGALTTAYGIVGFPAGTVALTNQTLAGFRMYFSGGSRESAAAPAAIPQATGRENLTPTGESIFLRAVQLAINNGAPPSVDPATPVGVVVQPTNNIPVYIGGSATFYVAVTGAAPRTIQWQRDIGDTLTFTNIPGATTTFSVSSLTLSNLIENGNNQARIRAVVSNPNNTVESDVAVLSVWDDFNPPMPLSAGSVDGNTVEIIFDELLDTNTVSNTATDAFSYNITSDGNPVVLGSPITIRPGGNSVSIPVTPGSLGKTFTVTITQVQDQFGNGWVEPGTTISGVNYQLPTVDVGALNPPGANAFVGTNAFQVLGGGLDIAAASDQFRFAYQAVTGDFDARVRVLSITGTNRIESVAKALLTARESTANNSAAVNVFVTTATPGDNSVSSRYRNATGAAYTTNTPAYSSTNTPQITPGGLPNAWLRIKRIGNQFTTYRSTDGLSWTVMDNVAIPLAATLNVGVGTTSHRNGVLAFGTFSDFKIYPPAPTLVHPAWNSGVFSASFVAQAGLSYTVQYRDTVATGPWSTLTNISGAGTDVPFSDPGPVSPTGSRFYRVRVD